MGYFFGLMISAVAGGIAGAVVAGVLAGVTKKNPDSRKESRKYLYAVLGTMALVAIPGTFLIAPFINRAIESGALSVGNMNRVQRMANRNKDAILKNPKAMKRFEGLTPAAAREEGRKLTEHGVKRLPDAILVDRARIMRALMDHGGPELCAGFWTGRLSQEQLLPALEKLEERELERWFELSILAMNAELDDAPARIVSEKEFSTAFRSLLGTMPEAEQEKLLAAIDKQGKGEQLSVEEMCAAVKQIYGNVDRIPKNEAGNLVRYLLSGG